MAAMRAKSSGWLTSSIPGVFGPKTMPASMKRGMVGRPRRRPRRPTTAAAMNAPPSATRVWPMAQLMNWSRNPARSSGRPITTSWSPTAHHLVGLGGHDRLVAPHDGGHGHPTGLAHPGLGDGAAGEGRALPHRHPVDQQAADDRLHPLHGGGGEVGAGDDRAEAAGHVVLDRHDSPAVVVGVGGHVEVAAAGVVDDDADLAVVGQAEGVPAPDAGELVLVDLSWCWHPPRVGGGTGRCPGRTGWEGVNGGQVR